MRWERLARTIVNELHLFAGAGGGILGGHLLGHTCVCAVEIEPYCRRVLLQRQRDGILPKFPIWDDVITFDGKPWRGKVDVVCGGFPCQDISCAGGGTGIQGKRSGLWSEMARIIGEIRPKYIFVENSPMLTIRGLGRVIGDISELGYNAKWGIVGASNTKLPHRRKRIWILGSDPSNINVERSRKEKILRFAGLQGIVPDGVDKNEQGLRTILKSGLCRSYNGIPDQVDRLKSVGNAQVPIVAATAFRLLSQSINNNTIKQCKQ